MFDELTWHNPPAHCSVKNELLTVETKLKTDFWNKTHYGFTRSDGHFFYREVTGDFTCEVTLHAQFEVLYDQLGLMVRRDDDTWLKTGLEYSDGSAQMSTVLTRNWSDWTVTEITEQEVRAGVRIRLSRHGDTLRVQKLDQGLQWQLVRLCYIDLPEVCQVGIMCCSPERAGFIAKFSDFHIGAAIPRDLHA